MGLENLKSIFTEGMNKFNNTDVTTMDSRLDNIDKFKNTTLTTMDSRLDNIDKFKNTKLTGMNSRFTEDFESLASDFQSNAPLLGESIVVGMSSKYTDGIGGLFNKSTTYDDKKFTPMSSLNVPSIEQILENGNYGDGYPTKLSSYSKLTILQSEPGNGISFSPAGEDLRAVDGLGDLISDITTNRKSPSNTSWTRCLHWCRRTIYHK